MTILVTKQIPPSWNWDKLGDLEIVESVSEDPTQLLDGATWEIKRKEAANDYG